MDFDATSLGAIIAAGITAIASLIGLIISKEHKTSEFRQAWIDALRNDLSELIGCVDAVAQHMRVVENDSQGQGAVQTELFEKVKPEIVRSEALYCKVLLRINPKEHVELVNRLEKIRKSFDQGIIPTTDDLHDLEMSLVSESQATLKREWERVKRGETTFRVAKISALIFVVFTAIAGIYAISGAESDSSNNPIQAAPKNGASNR
ncbi:hypothetical protein [Marinobacter sp. PE14]